MISIKKIGAILINKKRIVRLLAGTVGIIQIVALATTLPLNNKDYTSETSKRSWDADQYKEKVPDGYEASGLGVNETYVWPVAGKGEDYPLGALRYLEKRPGYDTPEDCEKFNNQYIYCVANHVSNYTMTRGMQAFLIEKLTSDTPFKYCAGSGDIKKFNFLMLAIACDYGTANNDYHPNEADNAYYGIANQAIAWVNTASQTEQDLFGVLTGEDFKKDLEVFRNYPIYRAVMNNSFPESSHPSIYRALHSPATGWHSSAGCKNWFEAVFADIWNSAKLTQPLDIDWEAEKSTLTGKVESGDDGYYHIYLNTFQTEVMKSYLAGISFTKDADGDWDLVEQTAEGIMHFKSPTGEMPVSGTIGKLEWPNGVLGGLIPKDISSAKLHTFDFYTPKDPNLSASDDGYDFGQTQIHFGAVIDKGLEVYITTGEDIHGYYHMERYKHTEEFSAAYNINLKKFDSETGKALEGAHFDILEGFNDSQLDATVLKDDNWANDSGSQFEQWSDPNADPCDRDDNITGTDGQLYEIYSNGAASNAKAHVDVQNYIYEKGYCGGHPVPFFIEIPEPEYEEAGEGEEASDEPTNQNEIDEAKKENDALLNDYIEDIQTCNGLESEGGYFCHADEYSVDLGASGGYDSKEKYEAECNENKPIPDAKKDLEADRDEHYEDFISLVYEYGAKEIAAPKGYILHGIHNDDIPIEVRVVTSSEYKDTDMATKIDHSVGDKNTVQEDDNSKNLYDNFKLDYDKDSIKSYELTSLLHESVLSAATPSEADKDFVFEDEKQEENTELDDAKPKVNVAATGYTRDENPRLIHGNRGNVRDSTSFKDSKASVIELPNSTIIDWTFVVFDHRTEGEIHINKQDFNLQNFETYDAYANSNGDGTLEGAVYGLFAATDLVHPDGHTGVVYKKDNLVAVAATDRDGDGSFMAITEAPGNVFNYKTGAIEATDWAANAPKNLHMEKSASAGKEHDIESFIGHNPDGSGIFGGNGHDLTDTDGGDGTYFNKYSSNQQYEDTSTVATTGSYPILNNEDNNGNCWIGRPLFVGRDGTQYYIKELSRSEGYELSVYGKDESLHTNREAFMNGGADFPSGRVSVSKIELDRTGGGNTFTVQSAETTDGYDVITNNIPEHAAFFTTITDWIWDHNVSHKERVETEEPVIAEKGSLVMADGHTWKAKLGDTVMLANGKHIQVLNTKVVDNSKVCVKPVNSNLVRNPNLVPASGGSYMEEVKAAFVKNKFRVPTEEAPWILVPFDDLTSQSIADAINSTLFTDSYYDVFNAMTLVGTTAFGNQNYAIVTYDFMGIGSVNSLYNESNDSIYVKKPALFKSGVKTYNGWIWNAYSSYDRAETNDSGFVTSAYVPNETLINDSFEWHKEDLKNSAGYKTIENDSYWTYAEGEQQIDLNGERMTKTVIKETDVKPTLVPKTTDVEITDVTYSEGQYKFHVSQKMAEDNPAITFRIKYAEDAVTVNGIEYPTDLYVYTKGVVSVMLPITHADSFIVSTFLTYPGQLTVSQDGGTGTTPINVLERPIRQQIKVIKDIQTNPDGTYAHDTYSKVHKDNLSADGSDRWYTKTADWLTNLCGGTSDKETSNKIDNFRFKAYLKSNLERLYRDENGSIVWLDRNGIPLVPQYQDKNLDGNYDTFIWKKTAPDGGQDSTIDFPEKQIEDNHSLKSSNVQKIYTKAKHNTAATTTGDNSNNIWASYEDPQTGKTENAGELIGYTTSHDGSNGEAVKTNASLYSYNGKNWNTKKTDKLNDKQNTGYIRLLETSTENEILQIYNYKKFFDAMAAANRDKWDNDMYVSNKNNPGQHWFETFYQKYQLDDADPDFTLDNTDGADNDGTGGGDQDTSFKPFSWIRENIFKENGLEHKTNIENKINTSLAAHENAEASDAVRQFAIDYYLQDEVGKLLKNNGYDEDEAIKLPTYSDEVYDTALSYALVKAVNYLKPFYNNDLDTIYSIEWDKEVSGGMDGDDTTLNVTETDEDKSYFYAISSYLPYGTYVLTEQQPQRIDGTVNDFTNKSFKTDLPKEVTLPSVYEGSLSNSTFDNYKTEYFYNSKKTPEDTVKNYDIRFHEEWSDHHTDDLRNYVIRAHNHDGDYEIYKYGLDADKLKSTITYPGGTYSYKGFSITQEESDPLKDYYNPLHKQDGANYNSHYFADDGNDSRYPANALEKRYHYGSISEHSGNRGSTVTMTGIQTAYEGNYAAMLVPWSVVTPVDLDSYHSKDFSGFADIGFRNTFYTLKLRIEKLDSETGENILQAGTIFALYAASRYTSQEEVNKAIAEGAPETTKLGDAKFYLKETVITGSCEFLQAMRADDIRSNEKLLRKNLYSGIVPAGTPVCVEDEQIILYDKRGAKQGNMTVYTTTNDVNVVEEENASKAYQDQNTGYFLTPQPIGAGVYVLAELNPPPGYARTAPVALEIYSDKVTYYMNGDMNSQVTATIYKAAK